MRTEDPSPKNTYHQRRCRLSGFDYSDPNHVYFVTICACRPATPFSNHVLATDVVESLLYQRQAKKLTIYAYVLMPDHLHLVASPVEGNGSLSTALGEFKAYTTKQAWRHGIAGNLWQRSYNDHIIRREEDLATICQYVLANPVRKGLAETVGEWPYSGLLDPLPIK